jgi:glycosyltransferase involved in cell wall biosynthesis
VKRLRILHIVPGLALGGAETLLFNLATRDKRAEHRVISLGPPAWYSDRFEEEGIHVEHFQLPRSPLAVLRLPKLYRLIKQQEPDVIQTWMYASNLVGGAAARLAGLPVVWGVHCGTLGPYSFMSRTLGRAGGVAAPWLADYVISCSTPAFETHAQLGYARAPGSVVQNGYDPEKFGPNETSRARTREALGIAEDAFLIGSIGRWDPVKDIPTLLRALRLLADRGLRFTCILVGQGLGANPKLDEAVDQAGCTDFVIPLGRRSDVDDLARAMDLHVLSSITESFGNTVAETMLSGTPNVVTDSGGPAMVVGDTGWVVPPEDAEKLADAMEAAWREWKLEPKAWKQRRARARSRIVAKFSFDQMAEAYEEIWQAMAKRGRRPKHAASRPDKVVPKPISTRHS